MKRGRTAVSYGLAVAVLAMVVGTSDLVQAGRYTFGGDDNNVSIGLGTRWSFISSQTKGESGRDRAFALENIRPYLSATLHKDIAFELNLDSNGRSDLVVLDAIAKGTHGEGAHFWIGRMLPPSDRANLSGPYFQNAWGFPGVAWQFPNIYAGRDNGVAYWGQYDGGKFKWQLGAFEGRQGTFNPNGKLLYAGRLTLNLWDPEPGYYNSSTYYGAKDILAIGLVGQSQADGGGTATSTGNFDAFSIDVLMEKNVGDDGGVVSIEGAYYSYTGGMAYTNGTGFWVLGSFLVAKDIDLGSMSFQMQPHVRYQAFDGDPVWTDTEVAEFGVAMISDGHNSRMTMTYGKKWDEGQPYDDSFTIGAQTQF